MSKPIQLLQQKTDSLEEKVQSVASNPPSSTTVPANVMTTDTDQEITGNKTFTNGINISTAANKEYIYLDVENVLSDIQIRQHWPQVGGTMKDAQLYLPDLSESDYFVYVNKESDLNNKTLNNPIISSFKSSHDGGIIKMPSVPADSNATLATTDDISNNTSSSSVRSKSYQFGENDFWIGSVNLIQDKLGVFVIVSLGGKYERGNYFTTLRDTLNTIRPPILLNTESEVYRFCNAESNYYIGQSGDFKLYIYRELDNTLKLTVECDDASATYDRFGFCIYGLIPDATLNIEEELSAQL